MIKTTTTTNKTKQNKTNIKENKITLGCATPLGRLRSVCKSEMAKWHWRSGQWSHFQFQPRYSQGTYLVQIWWLLWRQIKVPRILSQNNQNDLECQGQWPPFSITLESILECMSRANLLIQTEICDELSCGQGQTQARQYHFVLKCQRVMVTSRKVIHLLESQMTFTGKQFL